MQGPVFLLILLCTCLVNGSSHSESPGTASSPRSDLTDFYLFRSYEPGREAFTVITANINGLQEPGNGPNFSPLPSDFVFNLHIDNTGDAIEDVTFSLLPGAEFGGTFNPSTGIHNGIAIPVPFNPRNSSVPQRNIKVALGHVGQVTPGANGEAALNFREHYQLRVYRGASSDNRDVDAGPFATHASTGAQRFRKPWDNAGDKTFGAYPGGYANYSSQFIYPITIPGCPTAGRVFVGQRNDPFHINLGQIFDLVNLIPVEELVPAADLPAQQAKFNTLARKSITTFSVEVPTACLVGNSPNGVIGGWASVQYLKHVGPTHRHVTGAQKNRLGNPLVNEVFIGLTEKDRWNAEHPSKDAYYLEYIQYPTLPEIIEILFGAVVRGAVPSVTVSIAPNLYPRVDLVAVLLTGIPGVNAQQLIAPIQCETITSPPFADIVRLNTRIDITPRATQNQFGVIGSDNGGYPNGRRPGDDTTDIFLRVGMGRLCHPPFDTFLGICNASAAPAGAFTITDRAPLDARMLPPTFPFMNVPVPGSRLPTE